MECDFKEVKPYAGIDLCIPEDALSNEQKKRRCFQMSKYAVYATDWLSRTLTYLYEVCIPYLISMKNQIEITLLRVQEAEIRIKQLTENCVIPEEATYNMVYIDDQLAGIANTTLVARMDDTCCRCRPYLKLL